MKTLRDRLRISNRPPSTMFGVRYAAKIEGVTISMSRVKDDLIERALARLEPAGVTADTPTWEVMPMVLKYEAEKTAAAAAAYNAEYAVKRASEPT